MHCILKIAPFSRSVIEHKMALEALVWYSAANAMMMRSVAGSEIKSWGLRLMRRKGRRRALVAVARKLAVIMHRIWADGTEFRHEPLRGEA